MQEYEETYFENRVETQLYWNNKTSKYEANNRAIVEELDFNYTLSLLCCPNYIHQSNYLAQ